MDNIPLSIQNLNVNYITSGTPVHAVKDVSFDIQKGEIFGLVGESGSGKSTVAQAILRTLAPPAIITGGEILLNGRDILSMSHKEVLQFRWQEISIVMQSALNALNPVLSIRKQISDVLYTHRGLSKNQADRRIRELFDLVAISYDRLDSFPHELSGGMRQRIVLAIALALMPPIIIMDEPTTALDVIVERDILFKVLELRKELGLTILFITHDLNLLLEFADRLAVMLKGEIIETGNVAQIGAGGQHAYTKKLIGALPSAGGKRKKGLLPQPTNMDFGEKPLLEVQNLNKDFILSGFLRPKLLHAVKDVSFEIFPGEIVGLVGESGSGKSTIARLIARLTSPTSGTIKLDGVDILKSERRTASLKYRRKVQMVFQDPFGSLNSVHTVFHHLARPILRHRLVPKSDLYKYIVDTLETVGLTPGALFADKFPHEMSGGERQRVAIARVLSLQPTLIVADEPTSMLDVSIRLDILKILANLRIKKNVAILFITHDLASARYLADRIIVLQKGSQVENGYSEDLIQAPQHVYTKQLIEAASPGWLSLKISDFE
ncbi:MAG: ABC transporter ATP-binding protein [SAR324 cluster bacterium]|nr:ABC transporter ATP-binding protein [SAR324 cluster bacterium]